MTELGRWCERWLGSAVAEVLVEAGSLVVNRRPRTATVAG